MRLDPIPQRPPRRSFVGVVVVASEKEDLQVGRLSQARDLVPAMCHCGAGRIGGGLLLVRFMLGGNESDPEGLDGSNGASW